MLVYLGRFCSETWIKWSSCSYSHRAAIHHNVGVLVGEGLGVRICHYCVTGLFWSIILHINLYLAATICRDEEYDKGKRKKIRGFKHSFGGPNLFQEIAVEKSKFKRAKFDQSCSGNPPFRIWHPEELYAFYCLEASFVAILSNAESVMKRAPTLFFSPVKKFVWWFTSLSLGQSRRGLGFCAPVFLLDISHFQTVLL